MQYKLIGKLFEKLQLFRGWCVQVKPFYLYSRWSSFLCYIARL